jgi:acetylornithine aminotransferase
MLGVGLEEGIDAGALSADLLGRGLVVNVPRPDTVRLLPPLVVNPGQLERAVRLFGESLVGLRAQ